MISVKDMKVTLDALHAAGKLQLQSGLGEDAWKRIRQLEVPAGDISLLTGSVSALGVTDEFSKVIDTFKVPEGVLPAGFRPEFRYGAGGSAQVDLTRDISYGENGVKRPTRVLYSADSANPYEVEPIKDFIANLDFLAAVGANRINVSEQSYSIQGKMDVPVLTGGHKHVMDDAEWKLLCDGLNKLGKIAADRGFKLCFHHHMGTVVQTSEETDRMMANTDPRYVFLCYDTGHFTFAGEDPLAMLKKYVDRVGHVHLKDMRLPVVEEARKNDWSFLQAVRNGAFTVPGDGNVDFDPVFKVLSDAGYQGWLLVEAEQDPAKANPLEYAIKGRTYIREHTGL